MFYQFLRSPKVKYYFYTTTITFKHGRYELSHELPNELRLKISGNKEISRIWLNFIER